MKGPTEEMLAHARDVAPNEACGLVVSAGKRARIVRARNLAEQPRVHFDLDPDAWLEVQDGEEVVGIYHSHPFGDPNPSMADLVACEAARLPFHIVDLEGHHTVTNPSGYEAPYEGRPYVYHVLDCYSVIRDWYQREWTLGLPDFHRDPEFWWKGQNLYVDNYAACGFVQMPEGAPLVRGDLFLIQYGDTPVPNHSAIYLGDGTILHHARNRLSCKDVYGGMWQRHTTHHLRHVTRMNHG